MCRILPTYRSVRAQISSNPHGFSTRYGRSATLPLPPVRNVECGMRSIRAGVAQRTTSPFNSALRTPHSALVHGADARLSRREEGEVTHAVTHTPHPTHAWIPGSMMGVPAARPAAGGALMIACTGHTVTQSPQRVHEARKLISSAAPGGRK